MISFAVVAFVLPFLGVTEATVTVLAKCVTASWTTFHNQNPCQLWGNLQAACVTTDVTIPVLNTTLDNFGNPAYFAPSGANATACNCNTVAYNLMSACSLCQMGDGVLWPDEFEWSEGCPNYDSSGNLPSQASSLQSSMPFWAFQVENSGLWDDFLVSSMVAAGQTFTLGSPLDPSPTFTGAFDTFTINPFATSFPTSTSGSGDPFGDGPSSGGDDGFGDGFGDSVDTVAHNITRLIIIVVVVCVVVPLIVWTLVLVLFCVRQKRRKAWYGEIARYYANGGQFVAQQPMVGGMAYASAPFQVMTPSGPVPDGDPKYSPNSTPAPASTNPGSEYAGYAPSQTQDGSIPMQYQPQGYQPQVGQYQPQSGPGQYQPQVVGQYQPQVGQYQPQAGQYYQPQGGQYQQPQFPPNGQQT